mgnify:CR=1 FL=1
MALLTIVFGPARPNLVLLDDFAHALHPRAQLELVKLLKQLPSLSDVADLQIIATTYSPHVLDELDLLDGLASAAITVLDATRTSSPTRAMPTAASLPEPSM